MFRFTYASVCFFFCFFLSISKHAQQREHSWEKAVQKRKIRFNYKAIAICCRQLADEGKILLSGYVENLLTGIL